MLPVTNGFLTSTAGDSETISVPLYKRGVDPSFWATANLIFSAKLSKDDTDEAAVIQKFTGSGITEADAVAFLEFVPFDTVEQESVTLYCDVRGEDPSDGTRHTGANWDWKLSKPNTKHTDASIDIFTTEPYFGASAIVQTTPLTGETLVNPTTTKDIHHEVTPAADIAALTWPLPAAADMIPGRVYSLASSHAITALTISFAGTVRGTTLAAVVANQLYSFICISNTGTGIVRRIS